MGTEVSLMITIALIVLGLLLMGIFGVKNLIMGKHELPKLITSVFPFVVFGILYAVMGDVTAAAMATMLFMIGLLILVTLVTGLRSSFKL